MQQAGETWNLDAGFPAPCSSLLVGGRVEGILQVEVQRVLVLRGGHDEITLEKGDAELFFNPAAYYGVGHEATAFLQYETTCIMRRCRKLRTGPSRWNAWQEPRPRL